MCLFYPLSSSSFQAPIATSYSLISTTSILFDGCFYDYLGYSCLVKAETYCFCLRLNPRQSALLLILSVLLCKSKWMYLLIIQLVPKRNLSQGSIPKQYLCLLFSSWSQQALGIQSNLIPPSISYVMLGNKSSTLLTSSTSFDRIRHNVSFKCTYTSFNESASYVIACSSFLQCILGRQEQVAPESMNIRIDPSYYRLMSSLKSAPQIMDLALREYKLFGDMQQPIYVQCSPSNGQSTLPIIIFPPFSARHSPKDRVQ